MLDIAPVEPDDHFEMTEPAWVQPLPPRPIYRRRPVQLLAAVVIIALVAVVLVIALSGGKPKATVVGSFVLQKGQPFSTSGESCTGTDKYAGLKRGGFVTLYGEGGDFLTSGTLRAGIPGQSGSCTFNFDLGKVDTSAGSYTVVVAGNFRSTKSKSELKAAGYAFYFQVG